LGLILIVAVGLFSYLSGRKTQDASDITALGKASAPVLVETYEDFLCPHCADFTAELGPILHELADAGLVRWEYKYRVISGTDSVNADLAAECAANQGRFWEYHEELFRRFMAQGKEAVFPKNLKQLAADLNLDTRTFDKCLDTRQPLEKLKKIDSEAAARGVNGTPTIFINGKLYSGARDPDTFRAALEDAAN
jgi:protein-disulfide isomerase